LRFQEKFKAKSKRIVNESKLLRNRLSQKNGRTLRILVWSQREEKRYLEFVTKVIDETRGSRSGEVTVEPSEEEGVLRERLQETSFLQQNPERQRILHKDLIESQILRWVSRLGQFPGAWRKGGWIRAEKEGGGRTGR
jgi:hypothetical protein